MTKDEVQAMVSETLKSTLPAALKDAMKAAGTPPAATEPTEVEKAVTAALKAAGVEPKEPAAGDPTEIEKAVAAALKAAGVEPKDGGATVEDAVTKAIGTKVEDAITKALAKGATETDPAVGEQEESFV